MTVRVTLHAILRKFLPPDAVDQTAILELPDGATVADAIANLGIPAKHASMLVSGDDYLKPESPLRDGQQVDVFPPIAGGSSASVFARQVSAAHFAESLPKLKGRRPKPPS